MEWNFTVLTSILAILVCFDVRIQGLTCNVGSLTYSVTQSGCTACQTTTAAGIVALTCALTTCYPMNVAGTTTTCCQTDQCNTGSIATTTTTAAVAAGGTTTVASGGSNSLTCYDDISSGGQRSGCYSCMKTTVTFASTTTVVRACAFTSYSCNPTSVPYTTVNCCQTNLCNQSTHKIPSGIFIALAASLAILVGRRIQHV